MSGFPFGGENIRNANVSVGTSSVLLSTAHERKELIISNTGSTTIYISMGGDAVINSGIYLLPTSVYYATKGQGFEVSSESISAIGSAGGGSIAIFER